MTNKKTWWERTKGKKLQKVPTPDLRKKIGLRPDTKVNKKGGEGE